MQCKCNGLLKFLKFLSQSQLSLLRYRLCPEHGCQHCFRFSSRIAFSMYCGYAIRVKQFWSFEIAVPHWIIDKAWGSLDCAWRHISANDDVQADDRATATRFSGSAACQQGLWVPLPDFCKYCFLFASPSYIAPIRLVSF